MAKIIHYIIVITYIKSIIMYSLPLHLEVADILEQLGLAGRGVVPVEQGRCVDLPYLVGSAVRTRRIGTLGSNPAVLIFRFAAIASPLPGFQCILTGGPVIGVP